MEPSRRAIRTAVVGVRMGRAHAHAYRESPKAEIKWVVDLDRARGEEVAAEVGCSFAEDMASSLDDVDAVSLCLPHHLHAPNTLQALEAGKHVLIEKPMAMTKEECLEMINAAESRGLTLMVAYPLRYLPEYVRLKQAVESQEFGRVIALRGTVDSYIAPRPGSWFSRKDQLGGGVLFSHGCHDIDIMVWLMGKPVRSECVTTRIGTEWMEGEGTAQCIFQFESGAVGTLSVSWGVPYKERKPRLQVITTDAMLSVSSPRLEVIDKDGSRALVEPPKKEPSPADSVRHEIDHFLDAVLEGKKPLTDGWDGVKALEVVWDLYARMK